MSSGHSAAVVTSFRPAEDGVTNLPSWMGGGTQEALIPHWGANWPVMVAGGRRSKLFIGVATDKLPVQMTPHANADCEQTEENKLK